MDILAIVGAVGVLAVLGVIFGAVLGVADKAFYVETDPRVERVREAVAGANCGACGFPGCDGFAQAVVDGQASFHGCTPGGVASATAIAEIMGLDASDVGVPMVAKVLCQGKDGIAKARFEYDGYRSCRVAASISGGPRDCRFACLGLGDCERKCMFDAITMKEGIAHIDPERCTACGMCVAECPRSVIRLMPRESRALVLCRNTDSPKEARAACARACISCKRCEKECQFDAIHVIDGCAVVDYDKCTSCGACVRVCPDDCIVI